MSMPKQPPVTLRIAQAELKAVMNSLRKRKEVALGAGFKIRDARWNAKIDTLWETLVLLDQCRDLAIARRELGLRRSACDRKAETPNNGQRANLVRAKDQQARDTLDQIIDFLDGRTTFIPVRVDW